MKKIGKLYSISIQFSYRDNSYLINYIVVLYIIGESYILLPTMKN